MVRITERPNDFGRYQGSVVYAGTCCCCCVWSITGVVGGVIAAFAATRQSEYRKIPKRVRGRYWLGASIGAAVSLVLAGAHLYGKVNSFGFDFYIWPLMLLPFVFLPAGIGGLIAAGLALTRLPKNDQSSNAANSRPSLWPFWRITLLMWLGAFFGTLFGVLAMAIWISPPF